MPKEMKDLQCKDGYVLMAEAAQPQGTNSSANNNNTTNIKSLLAMARSSSASSYASGQAVEKMAQRARARPVVAAAPRRPHQAMETIMSNDDNDSNTNNAIMELSPQSASQKSLTRQQSYGQQDQTINQNSMTSTQGSVRQDEDVIVVETVNEHEDDEDTSSGGRIGTTDNNHQQNKEESHNTCDFTTFEYNPPQEFKHVIPMAMTVVAVIFIVGAILLFQSTHHQNRSLWTIASVWLGLACIFTGLLVMVRDYLQDDTRTMRQALFGRGRLWEMACTEYRNFKQDWREHVLLLKNEAENPIPDDEPVTPVAVAIHTSAIIEGGHVAGISDAYTSSSNNDKEPAIDTTNYNVNRNRSFLASRKSRPHQQQHQQPQPQQQPFENKRPKSKFFRVLVKPILLPAVMIGRKRREQRRREALDLEGQVENGGVAILS